MRRLIAKEMHKQMQNNINIFLLVGDLGYKMWDQCFIDFPERCYNVGAAEQAMLGIAVGLAQEGKIPFVYSITNFVLYRPFETIRNYMEHEGCPVKILASGRDKDYEHDGISHQSEDAKKVLAALPSIVTYFPEEKQEIPQILEETINNHKPTFISLKR